MEKDGLVNLPLIQNQLIETGVTYSFIQGHLIEPSIIVWINYSENDIRIDYA